MEPAVEVAWLLNVAAPLALVSSGPTTFTVNLQGQQLGRELANYTGGDHVASSGSRPSVRPSVRLSVCLSFLSS